MATGSWDGSIKLWNIESGTLLWTNRFTDNIECLAFAPDGRTLTSGGDDAIIQLWDAHTGAYGRALPGHGGPVFALAWHPVWGTGNPDGRLLASCSFDHTIWLWDSNRSGYRTGLHGHTAGVYDLAFTPHSRGILSGSEDGTLQAWDEERGQCIYILQGYAVSLYDVAWSPDGRWLASAGSNTLVTIWDGEGLTSPRLLPGHRSLVFGVAWSPAGHRRAALIRVDLPSEHVDRGAFAGAVGSEQAEDFSDGAAIKSGSLSSGSRILHSPFRSGRPLCTNEQQRANSSSCNTRCDASCEKSIQSCSSVAGQHDQVNVQALGLGKDCRHDITSQHFSLCHDSFRPAAGDSLFEVIRSILL